MSAFLSTLAVVMAALGAGLVLRCIVRAHTAREWRPLWLGLLLLVAAVPLWMSTRSRGPSRPAVASAATHPMTPAAAAAQAVIVRRCYACHSAQTSLMHAPYNLDLDVPGAVDRLAPRIYHQVVMLRAMPVSNATHMTEDERAVIAHWYRSLPASAASAAP